MRVGMLFQNTLQLEQRLCSFNCGLTFINNHLVVLAQLNESPYIQLANILVCGRIALCKKNLKTDSQCKNR